MQILNVAKGGSLIIDLPEDRNTMLHQQEKGDSYHSINIIRGKKLFHMIGVDSIIVNSNHHQAVDRLADGFEILAYAPDSTIESMIWKDTLIHPFVLGVQWHPERTKRGDNAEAPLAKSFLKAISHSFEEN